MTENTLSYRKIVRDREKEREREREKHERLMGLDG